MPAYLPLAMEALSSGDLPGAKAVYKEVATLDAQGASLSAIGLADIALVRRATGCRGRHPPSRHPS